MGSLDPGSTFSTLHRMERLPCVYLLATSFHGSLYTGVTSNLMQRIVQHREEITKGHTTRYGIKRLVWFEMHETMETAIVREKRIKRWLREWKLALVEAENPTWRDLAEEWGFEPLIKRQVDPGSSPG